MGRQPFGFELVQDQTRINEKIPLDFRIAGGYTHQVGECSAGAGVRADISQVKSGQDREKVMGESEFIMDIDGRRVSIDQANQRVTILDEHGSVVFRDRIQVAAGSLQGLFSALDGGLGIEPAAKA